MGVTHRTMKVSQNVVRKRYPKAIAWRASDTWRWIVTIGESPHTRIGVGDTRKDAWEDAAYFIRQYGG